MNIESTAMSLPRRIWTRRDLFLELTKRDIAERYSGSFFGLLWSFFNPLLMLCVYTFAFRELLGMRWPNQQSGVDFSLMILCGLIVHSLMAECLMRGPGVIISQSNLVKRVVFPLGILPCVMVTSSLFNALLSVLVLLIFVLFSQHSLHATILYLPILFMPYVMLLCGVSWFMASLGVFVRDVSQIAGVLSSVLMFLSPVFYPATNLHEPYRDWINFNPLTLIIEQTRQIVLFGKAPDWSALGIYSLMACAITIFGYVWFQRTRDGFADVL
jgi:lipopolysaccharide transport system permease protein